MPDFARALRHARAQSDALFATLAPEAWLVRPVAERHRLLFYLGHLTADWPPLAEVRAWLALARADVDARGAPAPLEGLIALEHRLMHVETLSYLFEQLPEGLWQVSAPATDTRAAAAQRWLDVSGGPVRLGLRRAEQPDAGWCNEYEGHTREVKRFAIAARKSTNAEWLEFIEAGGYREARWWTDDDWRWVQQERVTAPLSWTQATGGEWRLRSRGASVPLPGAWPVFVSHAEATAFARWKGARLPTEAEWHRAVHGSPDGTTREFPWGDAAPVGGRHGNFDFAHPHPTPVGAHPDGASAFGLDEPVGNGWEWTSTPFAPFEGFERYAVYPGYSADFFDGRHFVLAGASHVTAVRLARRSFRNWFQPHYRAVFATVRLARDDA